MRILISNDDGVLAPGISALSRELTSIAEIEVIAPDRNRSGASNSLSLSRPLHIKQLDNGYHCVDGTPTDCVHVGLTGYFDSSFDMVVSGINDGSNLGDDVLYSGTVAAAMEGRSLGLPALAISMVGSDIKHYETAALITKQLILKLKNHSFPASTIFNINVPDLPMDQIKGIEITRLGTRHLAEATIKDVDPRGRTIYWVGPPGLHDDAGPGTDFFAVQNHRVSVTPLHIDMTNYKVFEQSAAWIDGIN